MTPSDVTPTMRALRLARTALLQREWNRFDLEPFSPVCLWCGGYQRTPAMDQDYGAPVGHKMGCARQRALGAIAAVIGETTER